MSKVNDGGPFHPMSGETGYAGISLRDWFAGMAMQGMLANSALTQSLKHIIKTISTKPPEELVGKLAYDMADAMIEARGK